MIKPDTTSYQEEQVESSKKSGNSSELIEMIRKMEQGMFERDSQLKAHLEKRDQYFEEEIRKRDFFMDEAINQRDA